MEINVANLDRVNKGRTPYLAQEGFQYLKENPNKRAVVVQIYADDTLDKTHVKNKEDIVKTLDDYYDYITECEFEKYDMQVPHLVFKDKRGGYTAYPIYRGEQKEVSERFAPYIDWE